jgi:putative transposase
MHVTLAQRRPLGRLIGAFKTVSTQRVNDIRDTRDASLWQRDYYGHVIRNGASLRALRHYIITNPSMHGPAGPIQS